MDGGTGGGEVGATVSPTLSRLVAELQDLPGDKLEEVLDFVGYLKAKLAESPAEKKPRRGSAEALLECAGIWEFEPGELDKLLEDIERMREMEGCCCGESS
jgi:hypothetical protein